MEDGGGENPPDEVMHLRKVLSSPPTGSSCQALRHAVATLNRLDDFASEKIGSGFFSEVFKVIHRTTGQVMVLKMNMSFSNRSNMLREVQLMNRLSHPNILRFMGVCVNKGQLHALTEFINGGSLEQLLLNKNVELTWPMRIKLAVDIASGMSYLHSRGVFHRDLTSKNVLIKSESNELTAVVGDFGLAEKIPDPMDKRRLPVVGSPYWMAPECLRGKLYNEKADVFSNGIILCEIIARIEADPDLLPRTENFGVDYVMFSEMCTDCPAHFLKLAFSCCRIEPKSRPSFAQIVELLELNGSYKQDRRSSQSVMTREELDSIQAVFAHWRAQTGESPSKPVQRELTPKHIGQFMSQRDPHYKPSNTAQNPFASLSCFRDGKKIVDHDGCCKNCELQPPPLPSSPSRALTPPPAEEQHPCSRRIIGSHSLPASPTLLRRTLVRMHSARSSGDTTLAGVSSPSISLSPEPPLSPTDSTTLSVPVVTTDYSSYFNGSSSCEDDIYCWEASSSSHPHQFTATTTKRPSSYHSDDSGCCISTCGEPPESPPSHMSKRTTLVDSPFL